ncbi:MAG: Type 1 glutamine amidotransferase-like domain-containing protein, partial [Actinomycetota bacterium]
DELRRGNEPQDRVLADAAIARGGPAFVLATAAARHRPDLAVRNAVAWFAELGLAVEELPVRSRDDARSAAIADRASSGSFFYLVGGDPGFLLETLRGTETWDAIEAAGRAGAALGGSSAGAMGLAAHVLLPGGRGRAATPGLGLVPGVAVIPHLDTFGASWQGAGLDGLPDDAVLVGIGERTAAVFEADAWRVLGDGAVTLLDGTGRARRHEAGGPVHLPFPS